MKTIGDALEQIINDGIEAVKKDYKEGTDEYCGSIAGFEACRGKNPGELVSILSQAKEQTTLAFKRASNDITEGYWFVRCFELEIEWVCNVLSAILQNNNLPIIVNPTCRGVIKAVEIIGIKEKD